MASLKSSRKRHSQSVNARSRNRAVRSQLRNVLKSVRSASNRAEAAELLPAAISLIDRTAKKGVIHDNAAGRHKSKLTRIVNAMA